MTTKFREINSCLICENKNLLEIIDLGDQFLTGVFPHNYSHKITHGPLKLVKCMGSDNSCGLVQLKHIYDASEMYGNNYGYRSGLNKSMVGHLHNKISKILKFVNLKKSDLIIDIGSNDSTALQAYPSNFSNLVGIDPAGEKFKDFYPPHIDLITDFFSSTILKNHFGKKRAKVITSFSMFYDLEDPIQFMRDIFDALDENGIWVFEQSYLPAMLKNNSYDTICHEHLEYYALKQIKWMSDLVGFKIVDIEFNEVNGGSFSVTVAKKTSLFPIANNLEKILLDEIALGLDSLIPFNEFRIRVDRSKKALLEFIRGVHNSGKIIYAIGASTKGNVLLQYCNITPNDIPMVGEVNPDKYDKFCPGTYLPIFSEDEVIKNNPDYLLILPWHFRDFFVNNPKFQGIKLVFPLPALEIVG